MKSAIRKTLVTIVSILFIFSLSACNGTNTSESDSSSKTSDAAQAEMQNTESTFSEHSKKEAADKTLVVYYSATGSTKRVAEYIASEVGGDLFEIVPVNTYTDDDLNWSDENSRVVFEHDNPDKRDVPLVKSKVDNFNEYDTVYIGYPIWWGIAAWPVNGFVEDNDFSGKTVIPFCTSASSDLGDSVNNLKELAKGGNWLEGKRFSSAVSKTEVTEWIHS